ncbi:ABC transporter substrate-binding protein [Kiloniella sp. EL199]|uniref:substrate-binding periplasmic protein n=1 Tax=Kiloniella sp. EL199 TaxID=2107581 RepID=UPI000EA20E53|nr:transporter substrate-binding domain-containing protein [Kiloniella sp. EL199]
MLKKLFFCIFFFHLSNVNAWAVELYTEDFPPYNYMENGELKGIGFDVIEQLSQKIGEKPSIKVLPWSRAYKYAKEIPGAAIFSIVRTSGREKSFHWVGPLFSVRVSLFALAGKRDLYRGNNAERLDIARKVAGIGVQQDGAGEEFLKNLKFQNLDAITNVKQSLYLLLKDRYDLLETSEEFISYAAEKEGILVDKFSRVAFIGNYDMYLAFSKKTSQETIQKWQNALEQIQQTRR